MCYCTKRFWNFFQHVVLQNVFKKLQNWKFGSDFHYRCRTFGKKFSRKDRLKDPLRADYPLILKTNSENNKIVQKKSWEKVKFGFRLLFFTFTGVTAVATAVTALIDQTIKRFAWFSKSFSQIKQTLFNDQSPVLTVCTWLQCYRSR